MVRRVIEHYSANRGQAREHRAAWKAATEIGSDGLTSFQRAASTALLLAVPEIQLQRRGTREMYLFGTLPSQAGEVYIYEDQAQVKGGARGFDGEHQDYSSPDDLISEFVAAARSPGAP